MYRGEKMLYTRKEISKKYNSTYQINRALENKEIFKIQNGIYSDEEFVNPLLVINKKYPNAIFTMDSTFYYWNLTDVIPDKFHLATKRNNIRYRNEDIRQYFVEENLFEFGKTRLNVENVEINIYDRERMLIELVRKKAQIPFDFYKVDFIKYSLDDDSIARFIDKLNNNDDGITIKMEGKPVKLHHQDYDGKRVNVIVKDSYNNTITTKLDIGVRKNFDILQDEYCFNFKKNRKITMFFITFP